MDLSIGSLIAFLGGPMKSMTQLSFPYEQSSANSDVQLGCVNRGRFVI